MKFFNVLFTIFFIIAAALQYNDPDPYVWMPIYLFGAFICYKAYKGVYHPRATIIAVILYGIYGTYLFFDKYGVMSWFNDHQSENIAQSMKATAPWIEETREFFGLIILIIVLLVNYTSHRRKKSF